MRYQLVVIPYIRGEAQGNELELALYGWKKFYDGRLILAVVGDFHPCISKFRNAVFIPCERVRPIDGQYLPHLDIANKLLKAYEVFPDTDGFVWSADDTYPVKKFDLEWIKEIKYDDDIIEGDAHDINGFRRDAAKTRRLLMSMGVQPKHYTTHLPYYFEWPKFLQLNDRYDLTHNSYILEDLYYNLYHSGKAKWINGSKTADKYMVTWHYEGIREDIQKAIRNKRFICNSLEGYCEELMEELEKHFCIYKY